MEEINKSLYSIYESAKFWQKDLLKINLPFSKVYLHEKSIDAVSLHIDLAYMLQSTNWCQKEINWLIQKQDSDTGLWFESFTKKELANHNHPRVVEMVGTYLGFQVSSLLLALNKKAKHIYFLDFLKTEDNSLNDYLNKMPWVESPWGAGGWVDSIATMIRANISWGDNEYQLIFKKLITWLNEKQSSNTGLWGDNKVQGIAGQVNGTYHLTRGTFFASNFKILNARPLLDSLIDFLKTDTNFSNNRGEGCYDLDSTFLLYKLSKELPNHRKSEVRNFALNRLFSLLKRRNSDGLYGYFIEYSQDYHNYHFVGNKTKNVSDIQGVVFYLTTIFYLAKIVDNNIKIPWRPSLTHG